MWARLLLSLALLLPLSSQAATETIEMVQIAPNVKLETTIFRPDGPGPFPVIFMNHGKNIGPTSEQPRARYVVLSREFLKRGYAVILPMRQSFSKSTGSFRTGDCDMTLTGTLQAEDVKLIIDHYIKEPWIDPTRIIVAGQSFGGLTAIAFGPRQYPGVRGTINFMGGLRFYIGCFNWRSSLAEAAGTYGSPGNPPSLWFYAPTDTLFGPEVYWPMFYAYTAGGGRVTMITGYPYAYKNDPHVMAGWTDGPKFWWPQVEEFLKSLDMPTEDLRTGELLPN